MLDKVFLLFKAYCEITCQNSTYIRFFNDFSGGIYAYDDIEMATFDDVNGAHEILMQLIKKIA